MSFLDDDDDFNLFDDVESESSADNEPQDEREQAFNKQVDDRIRDLQNRKLSIKQRRAAAAWLGESGEPRAIPFLLKTYKAEKDADLRDTIHYALGQFKALKIALDKGGKEQDRALQLIEGIVREGKFGRRLAIPVSTLIRAQVGLVISLLFLLIIAFIIPLGSSPTVPATDIAQAIIESPPDPITVRADLRAMHQTMMTILTTLEQQSLAPTVDCDSIANITLPGQYMLNAEIQANYLLLAQAAERLNIAQLDMINAKTSFDELCAAGTPAPLPSEIAQSLAPTFANARATLDAIPPLLDNPLAIASPVPTTEPPTPTDTPPPTDTPDPNIARKHVLALNQILSDMNSTRGHNSILLQYWTDIRDFGETDGCLTPPPIIPPDYVIPPEESAFVPPELNDVVASINVALAASRESWSAFLTACADNSLASRAANEIIRTQFARDTFTAAQTQLNAIRP